MRTYTELDGLPNSSARDIAQDAQGRLWLLTRPGLTVYDGTRWETFRFPPRSPLPDLVRFRLDAQGRAYTASAYNGIRVSVFDGQRWRAFPEAPAPAQPVGQLTDFALLPGASGVTAAIGTTRGGLFLLAGGAWRRVTAANGLPSDAVLSLQPAGERLYVGTERGLALLDPRSGQAQAVMLTGAPSAAVPGLALERAGSPGAPEVLWVQGESWVGTLRGERFTLVSSATPLNRARRGYYDARLAPDRRGGLYTGNADVLYHVDASGAVQRLGTANGLATHGAAALLLDREESLWIGSARGVSKLTDLALASYHQEHGLLEDEVTAILEQPDGSIVLGHNTGFTFLNGEQVRLMPFAEGTPSLGWPSRVMDLEPAGDGGFWAAVSERGLLKVEGGGRLIRYGAREGLDDRITSVRVDQAGRTWAGGNLGVYLKRGERFEPVPFGLSEPVRVRRLFIGPDGALRVATLNHGLFTMSGDTWVRAVSREGGDADSIFSGLVDPDGTVWVGSGAGLLQLQGNELRPAAPPFRVERPVYFLLRDARGRLWIGTDFGVVRWDGREARQLTVSDGLAGNETNRAAGLVDRQGRVWIGTDRGVSRYDPRLERPPAPAPLLAPLSSLVNGRERDTTAPLRLAHDEGTLVLRWRAVSLVDESRVVFESILEGYDTGWQVSGGSTRHESRYTGLPPGHYRYRIRARNADGIWSEVASSPALTIAPPFWRTVWFYIALALGLGALLLAAHQSVLEHRTARRLEREVESRTASLLASEQELAAALKSIADGVISTDREGCVRLLNAAAERLTGWSDAEAAGQPLLLVAPLRAAGSGAELDPVRLVLGASDAAPFVASCDLARRDGERRAVEVAGAAVRDASGAPSGAVLAIRDLTERRRMEEELAKGQRLESLGVLAGGLAHDLNNLLTVILGNLSLLRRELPADLEPLRDAESASLRARDLASRLLTFAKGGAPVTGPASPVELVEESLRLALSGSNVRAELALPADLWDVEVDRGQIGQVLNNLLLNAAQAMPHGGRVRISAENLAPREQGEEPRVRLTFKDEGPGIPRALAAKVFDPFFTTKPKGSGLGLTIAYSIVKSHGGSLALESEPGAGSTFHLTLRAASNVLSRPPAPPDPSPAPRSRILVMDDDETIRKVLGTMLRQLGHGVELASDGAEAVRLYERALAAGHPHALVILDLTVPGGMGGAEAARRLRALDPAAKVIATSGYADDNAMREFRSHGFTGVLPKPYRVTELERLLGEVLG